MIYSATANPITASYQNEEISIMFKTPFSGGYWEVQLVAKIYHGLVMS